MMKIFSLRLCTLLLALTAAGTAVADHNFGVGVKAGTLGIGVEGTWRPLPYVDLRLGANQYDYSDNGVYAGVNYDAEINLDNYYVTGNFRFPLSPFRLTGGLYSNVWPTIRVLPTRSARLTRSSASSTEAARGFSTNTCLPASTAARRCIGRKCGGVASRITSHVSITFL